MPAKLNAKKGDWDLEREIKNKEDIFCWKNNMTIFVAAVTKLEMLAATNARWKWEAVEKKWAKTRTTFPP